MCLKELPENWDALWLGGTELKTEAYSPHLKRLYAGTGGYGILFRNTMYDALIEELKKENYVADVCYMKLQEKFNCFKTWKNIILHKNGFSIIKNKYVSYPKLSRP